MTIESLMNRNPNDEYSNIIDAVVTKRPFKKFDFYYRLLTPDSKKIYVEPWYDYLLDRYNCYNSAGFTDFESQINSLMDGLEGLLNLDTTKYYGVNNEH